MSDTPDSKQPLSLWMSFLKRPPDPGLYVRFGFWLRSAESHRANFLSACKSEGALADPLRSVQTTVERLSYVPELESSADEDSSDPPPRSRVLMMVAALTSTLSLVLGMALGGTFNSGSQNAFATGIGGFERVMLEDGTVVEMNTSSSIIVNFSAERREVTLAQGEASFTIAQDPTRPFIVTAGHTATQALGTEFGLRLHSAEIVSLYVTDGRVTVRGEVTGEPRVVAAGEVAMITGANVAVSPISREAMAIRQAWRKGIVLFDAEPLRVVVSEINRYNRRQLVIVDPKIADKKFGGSYKPAGSLDMFLTGLQKALDIRADVAAGRDDVIELRSATRP